MASSVRNYIRIFLVVAATVLLDQYTKHLVIEQLSQYESIEVIPGFFNIILTFNKGAAFGFLAGVPDQLRYALLALTTVVALGVVLYFIMKDYKEDPWALMALAMILGGAFGNIIDRVCFGQVTDFLDVYYGSYHWPAFNVADSAICIGVGLLLLRSGGKKAS